MTKVDRQICIYEREGDKYVGEIDINEVPLESLLDIISKQVYGEDYQLYDCYVLDKAKLAKLNLLLSKRIGFDLVKYEYFLEATAKEKEL